MVLIHTIEEGIGRLLSFLHSVSKTRLYLLKTSWILPLYLVSHNAVGEMFDLCLLVLASTHRDDVPSIFLVKYQVLIVLLQHGWFFCHPHYVMVRWDVGLIIDYPITITTSFLLLLLGNPDPNHLYGSVRCNLLMDVWYGRHTCILLHTRCHIRRDFAPQVHSLRTQGA